jgi:hypothetical protein
LVGTFLALHTQEQASEPDAATMIQEPIVTTQQQFDQEQLEKHEGLAKDKSSLSPGRRRLIQVLVQPQS